jgi:hypothetical protein
MAALEIEWKTSTPLWPQGNGNAESVMKNTKTSKIKEGDIVICKQKPNNKLSPRFNPERFTIVERKGATATDEMVNYRGRGTGQQGRR